MNPQLVLHNIYDLYMVHQLSANAGSHINKFLGT